MDLEVSRARQGRRPKYNRDFLEDQTVWSLLLSTFAKVGAVRMSFFRYASKIRALSTDGNHRQDAAVLAAPSEAYAPLPLCSYDPVAKKGIYATFPQQNIATMRQIIPTPDGT